MSADGTTGAPKPVALVTASCRGEGFDRLQELCAVTYDPWIDQHPLRIWDGAKLAERVEPMTCRGRSRISPMTKSASQI